MYKVNVYDDGCDRWMNYTVTPEENRFNGYVKDSKGQTFMFTQRENVITEEPKYYTGIEVYPVYTPKPSVYKRYSPICRRDEYKYQFTNVIRKTKEETHDVYYSPKRKRFLDKVSHSNWYNETYGLYY